MRILHIIPGLMTGGQETMLINIANEQVKGNEIVVMIINKDYDQNLVNLFDKKVKVICLNRPRSSKNPWFFIKLNMLILKIHPNVVHSHYEKLVMYLIRIGYKFVYTIHGFGIPIKYLKRNRNIVSISKGIQKDAMDRAGVKSVVVYNGIKVENIRRSMVVKPYQKDVPYKIVQVSRLFHEIKGQDILISAIAKLKKRGYNNLHVDFIGEGDSLEYLRGLVTDNRLDGVNFLGTKSVEYINSNLCNYNLFVQASRHEGFGLTVAEAMSAKIPVVSSNCDGLMEVVGEGEYGLTFDNGSVDDCANKIEQIMTCDIEMLQNRVDSAYKFVNENFNIQATATNYLKFYKQCE